MKNRATMKHRADANTEDGLQGSALRGFATPGVLLRAESIVLLATAVATYAWHDGSWWLFALLLLVPDVSMLGYLASPRAGATAYNLVHAFILPGVFLAIGGLGSSLALDLGLIWGAHIAMDRVFGYGLKTSGRFKETHLGRTGSNESSSVDLGVTA